MNHATFWFRVRDSLWFLPLVYGICSIIAVGVVTAIDSWLVPQVSDSIPNIFLTGQSIAKNLYAALITATLTMTTISFSTIMVVLTTYSSQFSPRALQDFMRSKITQHVLGVYTFGFIFVLINLWLLTDNNQKELLSPFFTVIIAITSLGFFILFIHYAAHWVQVNFLIGTIRNDTSKIIREAFAERAYGEHQHWDHSQIESIREEDRQTIYASRSGYIQKIDYNYLINWATTNHLVLEANFQVGDYVPKGMPVFYFWAFSDINYEVKEHDQFLAIGDERTDLQDIEFSMEKLVEIAVKALSTSMNDPNTAINSINRIGGLLTELAGNYRPVTYYSDNDGQLRLIMEQKSFRDYLYKSFYQIKHYGKDDISVVYSIVEALYKLAIVTDNDSLKMEVWNFNNYILESVEVSKLSSMDYQYLKELMKKFADLCGEELNWE
ncbi:DUF2254 domain-containing protein [Virgibacillus sp. NKC19-16]|uniref:DUF2254 domain-containing protein n=1 Tax=Virgibacillus salidurans TaxID=2831673 RepID=UPI001F2EDF0D|nr:DUF2254 domain-containing protein [Virgibacillus sp. NKC19-16]UJL46424.1 DUF2254 domain-containing protein [Virgibacillus sp. NKC19-16]